MSLSVATLVSNAQSFSLSDVETFLLSGALLLCVFLLWHSTRPKRFYFVRHGETLLNKAEVKQGAEGKLSEAGVMQAQRVGLAFRQVPINAIYSSPYERAVETATLIQKEVGRRVQTSPLLAERRNASEVIGKSTSDPEVVRIMGLTAYGYHADDYRFSDEENFLDLKARAKKCLRYLEQRPRRASLVITHHAFLQMLLSYMLYRDRLRASDYVKLAYFNPADNASVTVCDYHPWPGMFRKTHGWEVITYNQPIE